MTIITNDQIGVGIAVAIAIAGLLVLFLIGRFADRRRRVREDALAARELAVIVEETKTTAGGVVSMIMLVLTILYAAAVYVSAKTVFQQIEAGVMLIGGCIIWGLGVALGRARTYRVYRSEHREPI